MPEHIGREGYTLEWILDTHPHADHFSAAGYLKHRTGVPTAIGEKIVDVQRLWKRIYNLPDNFPTNGSQWDRLFADGERFKIGNMDVEVMFSPGHTLASITYIVGDAAFIHDTIFMPDGGTARADFPGGSASALWQSIERIMALTDETRLFTGHDYCPGGRKPRWESTVAQQRAENIHLTKAKTEGEFVALREKRDRKLSMPRLILHSLQVNIRGGRLPEPENNGSRYLRIPLDALDAPWDGRREPPLMELAVTMRPSFGALTKYEIAVNLKTAKALGLTMPAHAACAWRRGDRIETTLLRLLTAAYGTKRTCQSCRSMSAFGGKADRCTALGGYPFP